MRVLRRLREVLHNALEMWSLILVGELIAVNKPRTDFRR
jgi:hypothetical protein